MFHQYKNPPQWLLDGLLADAKGGAPRKCVDCAASPGEKHDGNCDVARCYVSGSQRLSCGCGSCTDDVWTGLWPGVQEAYDQKLACFDDFGSGNLCFDLNSVLAQGLLVKKKNVRCGRT